MIELGPGADVIRGIGILTWLFIVGALIWAWSKPRTRVGKYLAVATVLGLLAAFPGRWAWERQQALSSHRASLAKARAIFQERCKNAGEKIYRTVEGVEAIAILRKRRYVDTWPQIMEDPFGAAGNPWESDYPLSFLLPRNKDGQLAWGGYAHEKAWNRPGYAYVDLRDQDDDSISRYTLAVDFGKQDDEQKSKENADAGDSRSYRFVVNKSPSPGPMPRYGVIFEDLTTPEERALWVAGGAFRVLDLERNEVLGERIGYFMDGGLGSAATARMPWIAAKRLSCPDYGVGDKYRENWDREFTEQVLKIKNP
ncbi:hypothetical protein [Zoogloea sp.]|uniref:hypothetical protein n=1 Tax=Zoogloea sp. TaxID=49181 RepID=UPI0025EEFCD9|nr:hypothetical protein [Zoogloea sp.]MCK6394242.1 hypothetical protein [Zoogloea sp.]